MARFCTECGKPIEDGMAFCVECGAKAPAEAEEQAPVEQPQAAQPPVQPAPTPAAPVVDSTSKVVGTGTYFWLMFLFAIPIVGFISCIIMAFAPKNKSLKNYAKAVLIWTIIGLVFAVIIGIIIAIAGASFTNYIDQIGGGEMSNYDDIINQLGGLGN